MVYTWRSPTLSDPVLGMTEYTKVKSDEGVNGPVIWDESILDRGNGTVRRQVSEGAGSRKFSKVMGGLRFMVSF